MEQQGIGMRFARALAAKDSAGMLALLHPQIEFRAMTPGRTWEAGDPQSVIDIVFGTWFEQSDRIEAIEQLDGDAFADRERVGYRLRVRNPEGSFQVEQQAYLSDREGQIDWMRVLCSGYRPA